MAVSSGESLLTLAAELSSGVTAAPAVRAAHVGRNQTHPARRAIGRHRHRAAVNHWRGDRGRLDPTNKDRPKVKSWFVLVYFMAEYIIWKWTN